MDYTHLRERFKSPQWTAEQERVLLEPFTYLASIPGKEIRSHLIDAFNVWLKVPEKELGIIRNVVRLLHNASLLMDDVEDGSELRRGTPVSHTIFGIPQTINTANYVYFLAFEELLKLRDSSSSTSTSTAALLSSTSAVLSSSSTSSSSESVSEPLFSPSASAAVSEAPSAPRTPVEGKEISRTNGSEGLTNEGGKSGDKDIDLVPMVIDELLNLHRGQGLDLFWRDSLTCPTEDEYIQMVLGKTGGLFRLAVKLMMAKSSSNVDYVPLVNLISIYFQIRDDYMNLQSNQYADNKGFCEDLTEGKFSFPVVHGVRADQSNRQILSRPTSLPSLSSSSSSSSSPHSSPSSLTPSLISVSPTPSTSISEYLPILYTTDSTSNFIKPSSLINPTDVLQKRTQSISLKAHTVEYLRSHTRSFEYTLKVLEDILIQIQDEIKGLGGNVALERILKMLAVPPATVKSPISGKDGKSLGGE